MKTIVFRVDAGTHIGSGHVVRCLHLAEKFQKMGHRTIFICREFPGNLFNLITARNNILITLAPTKLPKLDTSTDIDYSLMLGVSQKQDAIETINKIKKLSFSIDWIVVDHYGISSEWDLLVRNYVSKIMAIDDLAHNRRDCDILLNQNYLPGVEEEYRHLLADKPTLLIGPKYALMNPIYKELRSKIRKTGMKVERIFVFYGGVDETGETIKFLHGCAVKKNSQIYIDVVIGENNPRKDEIQDLVIKIPNCHLYIQLPHLAGLMVKADLAFGAGGSTHWERFCLGLPTIVTITAENQRRLNQNLHRDKIGIILLGESKEVTPNDLLRSCVNAIKNYKNLNRLAIKAKEIVDGYGVDRVIDVMGV